MRIGQINLHHCKAASAILTDRFNRGHFDIILIQEPWIIQNSVKGLESGGEVVYNSSNQKTRTCIYIKRGLKKISLPEFCGGDITTIKLFVEEKTGHKYEVILCSAYFPHLSPDPPPGKKVTDLINFCQINNKQLILGCDANAHHIVWGSTDTNGRGLQVMDFILTSNLNILNSGNEPTFQTVNRREVLDLTLATGFITNKISNWHVSPELSGSDHRYIEFDLNSRSNTTVTFRNHKKTDWNLFREELDSKLVGLETDSILDKNELNNASKKLQDAIISSFENSCPLQTRKSNQTTPWYSKELLRLKRHARKLWNKAGKPGADPSIKLQQRVALNEYCSAVRAAKEAWMEV